MEGLGKMELFEMLAVHEACTRTICEWDERLRKNKKLSCNVRFHLQLKIDALREYCEQLDNFIEEALKNGECE